MSLKKLVKLWKLSKQNLTPEQETEALKQLESKRDAVYIAPMNQEQYDTFLAEQKGWGKIKKWIK